MAWQGDWNGLDTYGVNDAVYYLGSSYRSLVASNVGNQPDTSPSSWSLFAAGAGAGGTLNFNNTLAGSTPGTTAFTFRSTGASTSATARSVGVLGQTSGSLSGAYPAGSALPSGAGVGANFTMGVLGNANAGNVGVMGLVGSQSSVGVWGHNATSGGGNWAIGVAGSTTGSNADATGVYGQGNVGVRGRSNASAGFGVRGENTNTSGGVGLYGSTAAASGRSIVALGSVFIENRTANGSATSGADGLIVWSDAGASGFNASGALFTPSDRNSKADFTPVDTRAVLERVAAMPVTTWRYKNDPVTRHMGPTAQDFHGAFGLGDKDTVIHSVNADGVALAAIQGLNAKLADELARRDTTVAALEARVAALESVAKSGGLTLGQGAGLGLGIGLPLLGLAFLRRRAGK